MSTNPPYTVTLTDEMPLTQPNGLVDALGIHGHRIEKTIRMKIDIKDASGATPPHAVLVDLALGGPSHGTLILDPDGNRVECSTGSFLWHERDAQGNIIALNEEFEYKLGTYAPYVGAVPDTQNPPHVKPVWGTAEVLGLVISTVDATGANLRQPYSYNVHPEPGKPDHFVSGSQLQGGPADPTFEFWSEAFVARPSGSFLVTDPIYQSNAFYLADIRSNVTFGYTNVSTAPTVPSSNVTPTFKDQTGGGTLATDVDYPGYELGLTWSNNPNWPQGMFSSTVSLTYPADPEWSGGTVTKSVSLQFDRGTFHSLQGIINGYDGLFLAAPGPVQDPPFPITVSPGAVTSALPKVVVPPTDPSFADQPARAAFLITYNTAGGIWYGNGPAAGDGIDTWAELSDAPAFRVSLIDGQGKVATDAQFQIHLCPRIDHQNRNAPRLCTLDPVVSPIGTGVITSVRVNPNGPGASDSRGYMGVELLKAPASPGTYFLKFETLEGRQYRIRELSEKITDYSATGEYQGAFGFVTVAGGEFLDENFRQFPVGVIKVTEPTIVHLRYFNASAPGPATATLTSIAQDGSTLQTGISLGLGRVGSSQVYVGVFTAIPEGCSGSVPADKPSIQIALGGGQLKAVQASAAPEGTRVQRLQLANGALLAVAPTALPGKLVLKFMTRDGTALTPSPDGIPSHAGTVQLTEIGGKAENYSEQVWLEIRSVNPDPARADQIQDSNATVGIMEIPNATYNQTTNRFYDGDSGGTLLDTDGKIGRGANRVYVALVHGRTAVLLESVATARIRRVDGGFQEFPYAGDAGAQLQAIPALAPVDDPKAPSPGPVLQVNQWVDERDYVRRRTDSAKSWAASTAPNTLRDWLEKKTWDIYTDTPDDGTGELDRGCRVITTLLESVQQQKPASVNRVIPFVVTFQPRDPALRRVLPANGSLGWFETYSSGLWERSGSNDFPQIAMHESRHSWQYTLKQRGEARDDDDDLLFQSLRPESADLVDAANAAATPGGNGDGHFRGDNDPDDPAAVHTMFEHNAMRFAQRIHLLERLECAVSVIDVFSGDAQSGPASTPLPRPLVVEVKARDPESTGVDVDQPWAGTTVRFTVTGSAKVNGGAVAYAMTDAIGQASVNVTNGTANSQVTAEVLLPMAPQDWCPLLTNPAVSFTVRVGS